MTMGPQNALHSYGSSIDFDLGGNLLATGAYKTYAFLAYREEIEISDDGTSSSSTKKISEEEERKKKMQSSARQNENQLVTVFLANVNGNIVMMSKTFT